MSLRFGWAFNDSLAATVNKCSHEASKNYLVLGAYSYPFGHESVALVITNFILKLGTMKISHKMV